MNYLLENWAKGRLYVNAIRKSISTKTYPIKDAQDLLAKINRSAFKSNECQDLVIFVNSLIEKKAKTFVFGMDQVSLEFLLDWNATDRDGTSTGSYFHKSGVKDSCKKGLISLLEKVFYDLGNKYQPVQITSSFRTSGDQARIMSDLMLENKMLGLYAGVSKPYIELFQGLYDK
ncbi:MAG: hypothetical protein ACRCV0_00200 [Brevinema sp.]